MSKMADLDIVLTDYKLSDAQKNAVVELLGGGFTTAKANTIKSLETKGLVINKGDFYIFEEEFKAKLKGTDPLSDILEKEETTDGWMGEVEEELNTNMWDAPVITEEEIEQFKVMADNVKEEPLADWERELLGDDQGTWKLAPEQFQNDWAAWEKGLSGFGETLKWKNTDVWDGLTAQEIREDMDTALPIGRKARRERARLARKILSAV